MGLFQKPQGHVALKMRLVDNDPYGTGRALSTLGERSAAGKVLRVDRVGRNRARSWEKVEKELHSFPVAAIQSVTDLVA